MKIGLVLVIIGVALFIDMGIRAALVGIIPALTGLIGIVPLYYGIKRITQNRRQGAKSE